MGFLKEVKFPNFYFVKKFEGIGEKIVNLVLRSSKVVLKEASSTSANASAGSPSSDSQHPG